MKKIQVLFLLIFLVAGTTNIFAQKEIKEGVVKMEITKIDSDNEQMAAMMQMMKGSETMTYVTKEKTLVVMDIMGGMMKNKILVNNETKESTILFDAMGKKMMAKMSKEEAEKAAAEMKNKKPKITYDKTDKKTILDYNCYKATVEMEGGATMEAYVTDQLKMDASLIQGMEGNVFEGKVPLEYGINVDQQGVKMSMTYTVVEILFEIKDKKVLDVDMTGYEEVTIDQLRTMGGAGF